MKRINKAIFLPVIIAAIIFSITIESRPEMVFRKDGSIVQGTIVKDSAAHITLREKNGITAQIPRSDILRILYTQIYLGKVYIRLTSGKIMEGYVVDEDQQNYTVRKVLNKLDELIVPREKVMFVARSNPNELKAFPRKNGMRLTWSPPIREPSFYTVYIKPETGDFKAAVKTDKTYCLVTDLKARSKYWVKVTAVDGAGAESLPSNEVEVFTNTPPGRPQNIRFADEAPKGGSEVTKVVRWDPAYDVDGTISEYRIYRKMLVDPLLLGRSKELYFLVPRGVEPPEVDVRAVDTNGAESEAAVPAGEKQVIVEAAPVMLLPFGKLGEMYDGGWGAQAMAYFNGIIVPRLRLGISAGYVRLSGRGDEFGTALLAPVALHAGFDIDLPGSLSLVPCLRGGFVYIDTVYESRGESGIDRIEERKKHALEPYAAVGLILEHRLTASLTARLGADLGIIPEGGSPMMFSSFSFGIGYSFENVGFGADVDPAFFEDRLVVEASPVMMLPLGRLGEMYDDGAGAMATVRVDNLVVMNSRFGVSVGYVRLSSRMDDIGTAAVMPLAFYAGFALHITDRLALAPGFRLGTAAVKASYGSRGPDGVAMWRENEKTAFEPYLSAGLSLEHRVTGALTIVATADFGMLYESENLMTFTQYALGAGYAFGL